MQPASLLSGEDSLQNTGLWLERLPAPLLLGFWSHQGIVYFGKRCHWRPFLAMRRCTFWFDSVVSRGLVAGLELSGHSLGCNRCQDRGIDFSVPQYDHFLSFWLGRSACACMMVLICGYWGTRQKLPRTTAQGQLLAFPRHSWAWADICSSSARQNYTNPDNKTSSWKRDLSAPALTTLWGLSSSSSFCLHHPSHVEFPTFSSFVDFWRNSEPIGAAKVSVL